MLALFALAAADPSGSSEPPPAAAGAGDGLCAPAALANSNRDALNPCGAELDDDKRVGLWASTGTECTYTCDKGYIPIGRHVCQWHDVVKTNATTGEKEWDQSDIEHSFFGGRCQRLCSGSPTCNSTQSVRRHRDADADGECFSTTCFSSGLENLENVARGVFEVVSLSRDEKTGYYRDSTGEFGSDENETRYSLDATGLGMMAETVACELEYQSMEDGLDKVIRTVGSLLYASTRTSVLEPVSGDFKRDARGFFSHYSGSHQEHSSPMATGLAVASALFVKNYFTKNAAAHNLQDEAFSLSTMVDALYGSVDFTQILCDAETGHASPTGTGIPFTMAMAEDASAGGSGEALGARCGDPEKPNSVQYPEGDAEGLRGDRLYQFNEEHNAVHLAYQQACGGQPPGECDNEAIELMWNRWQGRRLHPTEYYKGFNVSTSWASYVTQLVYYTCQSFNSDPGWMNLFVQGWEADRLSYKQHYYQGLRGRYGLGEGPQEAWCTEEGRTYDATRLAAHGSRRATVLARLESRGNESRGKHLSQTLTPGKRHAIREAAPKHCQAYSANVVAAWMPARSGTNKA